MTEESLLLNTGHIERLCQLVGLCHGAFCRTGVGAAAAVHAQGHFQLAQRLAVLPAVRLGDFRGHKPQGTGVDASAAVDAGRRFRRNEVFQRQNGVVCLQDRVGSVRDGNAHHRAAVQQLFRTLHVALGEIQHILHRCSHGNDHVARLSHSVAVYSHHALYHRHTRLEIAAEECHRRDVHHNDALVCRQLTLHDGASQAVIDQHLFCALRVGGGQGKDLDFRVCLGFFRENADRLRLVGEQGRIRMDDWELSDEVQDKVMECWKNVTTENVAELSDIDGYWQDFYQMFGFHLDGVDYAKDVDLEVAIPSLEK